MDLTIMRQAETGRLDFKTYVKLNFKHSYLPYNSQHAIHVKLGICPGQIQRHLTNCSREEDYNDNVARLQHYKHYGEEIPRVFTATAEVKQSRKGANFEETP